MEKFDPKKTKQEHPPTGSLENPIIDSNMESGEAWRLNPNCKIPQEIFEMQVLVTVKYLSFDGKYHQGQIVVDKRLQKDVEDFFEFLIEQKFPVNKAVPVAHKDYNFDDNKSMSANNSSGFNPRFIAGSNPPKPSKHGMGWAIDINPMQNPFLKGKGEDSVIMPINPEDKEEPGIEYYYYNINELGTIAPWIADFLLERG